MTGGLIGRETEIPYGNAIFTALGQIALGQLHSGVAVAGQTGIAPGHGEAVHRPRGAARPVGTHGITAVVEFFGWLAGDGVEPIGVADTAVGTDEVVQGGVGMGDGDIAERLNCDPSTVRRNRMRLVRMLALRLYGVGGGACTLSF